MGARFVHANGVRFAYLQEGSRDAPLALCLHGFPDHALTWRHLLPRLAAAGFHAVAPWMRGYAPTEVPADGRYDVATLAADAAALHEQLGGDERAVLVGHDWGALAAYHDGAGDGAEHRWRALVTMAVPPPPAFQGGARSLAQLRRSWYVFAFQVPGIERRLAADDFALIDRLWADWSPGYTREPDDIDPLHATLRSPGTLEAAVGYYRALRSQLRRPGRVVSAVPSQPTLYLHGSADGCVGVEVARRARLPNPASRVEILDGAGHFLHLEQPRAVAELVTGFLTSG